MSQQTLIAPLDLDCSMSNDESPIIMVLTAGRPDALRLERLSDKLTRPLVAPSYYCCICFASDKYTRLFSVRSDSCKAISASLASVAMSALMRI